MGKISEVIYAEIDPKQCSVIEASEYYFYLNLVATDERFHKGYEEYEISQMKIRNAAIGDAIKNAGGKVTPKLSSTIFGVSSLKRKAVVITEVQ